MKKIFILLISAVFILNTAAVAFASAAYTNDKLRIRKTPSTDGEIVDVVQINTKLEVIEKLDSGWTKITYKGNTCYVKSEYLSSAKTAVKAALETAKKDTSETQPQVSSGVSSDSSKAAASSTSASYASAAAASSPASSGTSVSLDPSWKYADFSAIDSGTATLYKAVQNRKNKVIGVNAGHGTSGGESVKTYCHPDKTAKVTGGSTAAGSTKATAVSGGMTFSDGTREAAVTLKEAQILRDMLLADGYDVLMLRDSDDVQLDNVARTVMCNNMADCHIAIHWDGDGLDYDKGCFYCSVPDGIKYLDTVRSTWEKSEKLGDCLINGLSAAGNKIRSSRSMDVDLTQTSYSTVPSVDIELGNQSSDHSDTKLKQLAAGLLAGINEYFGY